jgi:hypothetical protein
MKPIVDGLEREFEDRLTVIRLNANVPANEQLQLSYGLRGHPTFLVLNETGDASAQFFGRQIAETLRDAMTAVSPPPTP